MGTDVKVATGRVAANTSTGDQDLSISGFGTPKAAIVLVSSAVTDGTVADDAISCIGFTDGTNYSQNGFFNEDAQTTMDSDCQNDTTEIIKIPDMGTGVDGEANFKSFGTDKMTITWGNAPAAAYLITYIFFTGADLSVSAGVKSAIANGSYDIDCGFEPDTVFFAGGVWNTSISDSTGYGLHYLGIADNAASVKQLCFGTSDDSAIATAENRTYLYTDRVGVRPSGYGDTFLNHCTVSAFNAGPSSPPAGFTLAGNHATNTFVISYLAMNFGGTLKHSLSSFDTTTTGAPTTQSVTDATDMASATPQFALMCTNYLDTAGVIELTAPECENWGISVMDATNQYTHAVVREDAVGTSNTISLSDNKAANVDDPAGTALMDADFGGFISEGFDLDWTLTDGTARKWAAFMLEAPPAAGTSSSSLRLPLLGVG